MRLSELKEYLSEIKNPIFQLQNGEPVPSWYHVTEIGFLQKNYIDCGGQMRYEEKVVFQLRTAHDTDHSLESSKLLSIIEIFEKKITGEDLTIQVEYQGDTIGKYGLSFEDGLFILTPTRTDCLAKESCGIPVVSKICCEGGCC